MGFRDVATEVMTQLDTSDTAQQVYDDSGLNLEEVIGWLEETAVNMMERARQNGMTLPAEAKDYFGTALLRGIMVGAYAQADASTVLDVELPAETVGQMMAALFAKKRMTIGIITN